MRAFFVNKRLAFGSAIKTWSHVERLEAQGITHVINLRCIHNRKVGHFKHVWLPFKDNAKPRPHWFYARALKFYIKAMKESQSKVFVMCRHGVCRSASLAYFLIRSSGVSPESAEAELRRARPRIRIARAYRESGEEYLLRVN